MTYLLYSRIPVGAPEHDFEEYLSLLPGVLRQKNHHLLQWSDKWLHLWGKILLREGLQMFGWDSACLDGLLYDRHNRPYISETIDFNISHSGEYVLCAISEKTRLGVDIEKIKPVDFPEFADIMTPEQWKFIDNSENPLKSFFSHWVIKESVIKADSRGMSLPLDNIRISDDKAYCDGRIWFLTGLDIDDNYCACLATDKELYEGGISFRRIDPIKGLRL